ncbi:hypothetical protein O163_10390 [Caldanaerobacter subterraneus subsp. yonseiensis KB-1]|uniref:Uncharacterized protein n=1 Tax=Caldanaerobacter subterraneus subsp. yonseiensis KB-1 TaxID=1388761 RepID=U5CR97_CALSX|nr:hypothetical protein [Caldanaerobacter subterraneus]ERM91466.1 hypothetical protein O163_10390 [Caldanaerobacter subterraneus subsp. yonseiensis KB-1]
MEKTIEGFGRGRKAQNEKSFISTAERTQTGKLSGASGSDRKLSPKEKV